MTIPPFKPERQMTCPHGRFWKSCDRCRHDGDRYRNAVLFAEQMERELRVERARKLDVQAR